MKWLTAFLCLLAMPAFAEELPPGAIKLPTSLVCGGYNPNIAELQQEIYGELPFLQGRGQVLGPVFSQAYGGDVKMFLNPDNGNFTLYLDIRKELTCLIVTGEGMTPIYSGKKL